jgi:DNA (cytosine-5)-methyltransferase 1
MPKKNIAYKLGELFCGPGGIGLGAKGLFVENTAAKYSINHVWATDYDEDSCSTYRKNILPDSPESVIQMDVRTNGIEKLLEKISKIDALSFGFPCNDFSIVGEQKGTDGNFGPLYQYGIDALHHFQPKWFLAENVGGLRSADSGGILHKILTKMEEACDVGYKVVAHLYKFEEYGVPQARHRIIIIGIREDLNVDFKVPSPDPYKNIDNTCKTAINCPPIPSDATNNELTNQSKTVIERLKCIKPGENAFNATLPKHLLLNVKGAKISQIYKRLDPTKPSYTVTGSGGGGTHVYHWEEPRALTNRERARLQTFPDDFVFCGSRGSQRKQIGMAVPPQGVKIIFEAVLKSFAGISYDSVPANISVSRERKAFYAK